MSDIKMFGRYGYSAFISYATQDDSGRNSWVSCFADELNLALPGRVRGLGLRDVLVPDAHLSGDKPLIAGSLSEQLRANVADSFSMFLFVHDNYNLSDWCLKELEYFKERFEAEGFRTRLYVIAMSAAAIDELTSRPSWKTLCPFEDQLWLRFFRNDAKDSPLEIYLAQGRNKRTVVASDFWDEFNPLLDDLARKIRDESRRAPRAPAYPDSAAAGAGVRAAAASSDARLVRVYIVSNPDQRAQHESLGKEIVPSWDRVVTALGVEPRLVLRPDGLAMTDIDQRPRLDDADGVVLLWNRKTPDAVAAQIKKVEPKLAGPQPAPGLVAYVMQADDELPAGMSIGNWPIVRFREDAQGAVAVLAEDAALLEAFLSDVLAHKDPRYLRR